MNIKRNIFLIYCYTFCMSTVFILPVIIPYFEQRIGLTFQQFLIGEAVFAAVIIAMEVPSGWMSDMWSRKGTLFIAAVTCVIGYIGLLFADSFASAVIAQAIIGAGIAFHSGTVTSLIYDTLAMKNKEHLYQKLEGKRHGISLYAIAIASILGGIAFQYDIRLPLMLDITTLIIAAICALLIIEPDRIKRVADKNPIHDIFVTMKYAIHGHREIAGIILVCTILFCTTKMFLWMQQPYMAHVGIPTDYFGYFMAGGFLFGGLIGHFGHYYNHGLSNRRTVMILAALTFTAGFIAMILQTPLAIIAIVAVSGIWGYGFPFAQNAINKHADPARRATILSTLGLLISLVFIPSSLILGWLDNNYDITYGIGYIIIQLVILSSIGFWLWGRRKFKH
jgi:MFS family permease